MTLDTTDNSIAILDKKRVEAFISKPAFPFLISFERTGSHWLRMVMELYFETPSLVRIFYYKDAADFTCYHRHDQGLDIRRENVIYLYRHPVETIYSNLAHYGEDCDDKNRIEYRSNLYGRHLEKWLLAETFTKKKTIITYEGMKKNMDHEFKKICHHFSRPFKRNKLHNALGRVTKEEVKRKTTHDPRVIDLSNAYQKKRQDFKRTYGDYIMHCIYSVNRELERFFVNLD